MEHTKEIALIGTFFGSLSLVLALFYPSTYLTVSLLILLFTAFAFLIDSITMKSGHGFPLFLKIAFLIAYCMFSTIVVRGAPESGYQLMAVVIFLTNEMMALGLHRAGVGPAPVRPR